MTTYQIIGQTNPYIAQRDLRFNGKTRIVLSEFDNKEDAIKKLREHLNEDYEFLYEYNSLEEFVADRYAYEHFCAFIDSAIEFKGYFESTKIRWMTYYNLGLREGGNFEDPGFYEDGRLIMGSEETGYEYDSRFYSIEEVNGQD